MEFLTGDPSLRASAMEALGVLSGMSLWVSNRAVDMEMFQFGQRHEGTDKRGQPTRWGDYALHVQCPWRIVDPDHIIVGYQDVYRSLTGVHLEGLEWDVQGGNLRDRRLTELFDRSGMGPLVVEAVEVDAAGTIHMALGRGIALEVFPDASAANGEEEQWRFFMVDSESDHFVVSA